MIQLDSLYTTQTWNIKKSKYKLLKYVGKSKKYSLLMTIQSTTPVCSRRPHKVL